MLEICKKNSRGYLTKPIILFVRVDNRGEGYTESTLHCAWDTFPRTRESERVRCRRHFRDVSFTLNGSHYWFVWWKVHPRMFLRPPTQAFGRLHATRLYTPSNFQIVLRKSNFELEEKHRIKRGEEKEKSNR